MMPTGIYPRPPRDPYKETNEYRQKLKRHWRRKYPEKSLLRSAYKRSQQRKSPFNLTLEDIIIPTHCPVLGMKLRRGSRTAKNDCPSIDEIVPGRGYIRGNICIISWRANRLKSDATLTEVEAILRYYRKMTR